MYFSPFSFPNLITSFAIPFGIWNVCFDERKNKIIQRDVTKILVARIIVATTYAPLIKATTPAIMDNNPPAKTSVTISKIAIHIALEGETPFLCIQ